MALEEKRCAYTSTLEIERVGECVRTDAVVLKQIFEFQRVLIHPEGWRPPQERSGTVTGPVYGWLLIACW